MRASPQRLTGALPRVRRALRAIDTRPVKGRVVKIVGTVIHAAVPEVRLGEVCRLHDTHAGRELLAEVIGLTGDLVLLTPIGDLDGLSTRTEVEPTADTLRIPFGPGLLGRTLDSLGKALDVAEKGELRAEGLCSIQGDPPSVLSRELISEPIHLGVRAIDALLTCGRGQRVGIFGAPGAGKSSLLARIISRAEVDVAVIALIGERGREVREFLEHHLDAESRARSVVVAATSDRPAMERVKAAYTATAIAERFRDQGRHVLLLMDNLTRFARAQREIGLAAGEPPTRRGFPPSVFAALPRLLERAGTSEKGAVTGLYSVLVEGDPMSDPIAEETRGILDGHIVLSTELADRGHFPAIDVLASRSRLMEAVAGEAHRKHASHVRELLARYASVELLIQVGEYQKGNDPLADEAIEKIGRINAFLRQGADDDATWAETLERLEGLAA
ncbi:MAG: FliI/YscN family ATPase [Kiloniellales bacterium]|nr:FliI/YscN family ATPase [Kiloniellales bacterium]